MLAYYILSKIIQSQEKERKKHGNKYLTQQIKRGDRTCTDGNMVTSFSSQSSVSKRNYEMGLFIMMLVGSFWNVSISERN